MVSREELTKVGVTAVCTFGLLVVAYNLVENIRYNGFFFEIPKKWIKKKQGEIFL